MSLDDETELFQSVYDTLVTSFLEWENRMEFNNGSIRSAKSREDEFLQIRTISERDVLYGRTPDGNGIWTGWIGILASNQLVVKLVTLRTRPAIYGTRIGGILDFDCEDAALFFGKDRQLYYTSIGMGSDMCDEDGWSTCRVHGPYDLRELRSDRILDPDGCLF